MNEKELKYIERRSEFSRIMRLAQQAKHEGDWQTVRTLQKTLSTILNNLSK